MVLVTARVRGWGNSLGIVIPQEKVEEAGLVKGQEVTVEVKAENPLKAVFGILKDKKIDAQKAKDELRKEWSKW
ncbi:hypothetical protein HYU17_03475 [Candidatus Woesearchaeota archaeon]|nr:hypothetical protein [Candidatus Woesearchaeota archaeon]